MTQKQKDKKGDEMTKRFSKEKVRQYILDRQKSLENIHNINFDRTNWETIMKKPFEVHLAYGAYRALDRMYYDLELEG